MSIRSVFKRRFTKAVIAALALVASVLGIGAAFAADPGVSSRIDYYMTSPGASPAYVDGTNQTIIPTSGSFTVEAYFRYVIGSSGMIVSQGTTTATQFAIFTDGNGWVSYRFGANGRMISTRATSGDWMHVALSYDSATNTVNAYANGNLQFTEVAYSAKTIDGNFFIATDSAAPGTGGLTSGVDEVKVFNTTRTQAQIQTDLNTYLSPSTSGLVAEYDFNEADPYAVFDRTANNYDLAIVNTPTYTDIATYTAGNRATAGTVKFARSYLTSGGGWYPSAGIAATATIYVYGAGGGGGAGGAASGSASYGGGGGGGGAGQKQTQSGALNQNVYQVTVGLGGNGGQWGISNGMAKSGRPSSFNGNTGQGGSGGQGGGYSVIENTTTNNTGYGGAGGTSGATANKGAAGGVGGATTGTNNGGGGGSNLQTATGQTGAVATTDTPTGTSVVAGGTGGSGYSQTSLSTDGLSATANTGSGGNGGKGGISIGGTGGNGANGWIVISYTSTAQGASGFDYYATTGGGKWVDAGYLSTDFNFTGDFTMEAWVNPTTSCSSAYCAIMGRENNYMLELYNGTYWVSLTDWNGTMRRFDTGVYAQVANWQHVSMVRSGATILLYVNGQLMSTIANGSPDGSGTNVSGLTATSVVGSGWFELGARGDAHDNQFDGLIDQLMIWNVARTATQIGDPTTGMFNRYPSTTELADSTLVGLWDMNNPSGLIYTNAKTTSTGSSDLLANSTRVLTNLVTSVAITNSYLYLDSTKSNTAAVADDSNFELTGSNFTISAWWKVPSCASTNTLIAKEGTYAIATDSNCKINIQLDPGNEGDAQTWDWMNTGYVLPLNEWHYVSAIKVGTTLYLYVDGVLKSTIANGSSVSNFNSASTISALVPANLGNRNTYFAIGSRGVGSSRTGITTESVDDVRLFNTDRRTSQRLDTSGFVSKATTGLQVVYDFNRVASGLLVNSAANASATSHITAGGSSLVGITASTTPPDAQPVKVATSIPRTYLNAAGSPLFAAGLNSGDYMLVGGGGGGGSGGTSGSVGGGGGAGAMSVGTYTGILTANNKFQVGVGGRYAINSGDSVPAGSLAGSGSSSVFASVYSAAGGGAGGSATATPAGARSGASGSSGGGSAMGGGSGGTSTAGYAGGAGSSAAAGGGGGSTSVGEDASSGIGGSGGKGTLQQRSAGAVWVAAGGSALGTSSNSTTNSTYGATAAAADAAANSGSGGGGGGFAAAGSGKSRGGYGANGFIQLESFYNQPFIEQGSTAVTSGAIFDLPITATIRDITGSVANVTDVLYASAIGTGCSVGGATNVTAVAGSVTFYGLYVKSTGASSTCTVKVLDNNGSTFALWPVSVIVTPASITIASTATTGTCSFNAGLFTCASSSTTATLNVTDLNNQLNANDVRLVTSGGDVIANAGLSIGGSVGSLSISSTANIKLNSGIALTGAGKGLTLKSGTGYIYFNDSATSGAQTTFSTNGGDMFFQSGTGTGATNNVDAPIKLSNYNNFLTNGGKFTATGGSNATTGYASGGLNTVRPGVSLLAGTTISTGSGDVLLRGSLGGQNAVNYTPSDAGIALETGSNITTTSGAVNLYGLNPGFSYDTGSSRQGVRIAGSIATDSGPILINGVNNGDTSQGNSPSKLSGASITSNSGSIDFQGTVSGGFFGGWVNFASPQSTVGSGTGNVTFRAGASGMGSATRIDYLKLTGGGTQSFLYDQYSFQATSPTSTQFYGTGDFVLGNYGSVPWASNIALPANLDFGNGYKTVTLADQYATGTTGSLNLVTTIRATDTVTLKAATVGGTGAVIAPKLAITTLSTTNTSQSGFTGASDVTTLAISRAIKPATCSSLYIGINDANGWTPGTVNGVTPTYGTPTKLGITTQPTVGVSPYSAQNQPLAVQPVVTVQDAWDCSPTGDSALAGFSVTPTASGSAMAGLTSVVSDSAGRATFSGLTPLSVTSTTLNFTASPTLTSVTSNSFTAALSTTTITQAVLTQGSTTATSGVAFVVQPKITYKDAYGNNAVLASAVTPTVTLTSYPAGYSTALTNTAPTSSTSAVWTGAAFKITGATGSYTITFTVNSAATGNQPVTATLTVAVTGWTLSYAASTLNYSTTPYAATFQGNGTGAVTYSSSNTSYCTVDSSGNLTTVTAGSCTITASQAADGTYPAGSATFAITVQAAPQATVTVSASPTALTYQGSLTLTGAGGTGTGAYTYSVVSGNCSINTNVLTGLSTGNAGETCVVTASRAATTGKYLLATSAQLTIAINKAAQSTAVTVPTGRTVGYGNTVDLSTFTYSGGNGTGAFVFSTSTPGCSITGTVLTSTAAIGSNCVVAVQRDTSTNYLISNAVNMNVQTAKGAQTVSYVTVASSVKVNDQVTVSASSTSGLTVTYALAAGSSSYCSLSGATVTFTHAGTCVINASQSGDTNYNAATVVPLTYTVAKADQTITFGALTDVSISAGTKSVSATASSGLTPTFSVGANTTNSACTVSSNGTVTLAAMGVCEVIASQAGNTDYNAANDVAQTFNILRGVQSGLVITSANSVDYGNTISLTATGGNGSSAYVWNSTGTCSISGTTLTVGDAGSSCVVTLDRAGDASWFDATQVSQTITINKAAQATLAFAGATSVIYGNTLVLNTTGGSGTGGISYATTGTCTESNGVLTVGNAGSSCTVTATKATDTNYLVATTGAVTFTITRATQAALAITSGTTVKYAQTLALTTSGGSGTGAVTYATTGTCSVSGSTLTVGTVGSSCTVTATKAQSTNYSSIDSSAVTVTIVQGDQTISITSTPSTPKALGTYSVTATATSGLTVAISIDSSTSAVCSSTGTTVTFTKAGTCLINADQAGDSNWNAAAQVQQSVTVALADQTITFTNPGTKHFGDAAFSAGASTNSSLAIAYSLGSNTTNSSCSVTSSGTVTIADVGTCELLADQAGNDVYAAAAQASVTFTIAKGAQATLTITSSATVVYGNTISLTTSGGSGTGAVSYATTGTCSVSGSTLTVGDAGSTCTVTASKATDSQYTAISSAAQTITITKANQTISFTSVAATPTALGTYTVTATSTSGLTVAFAIDSSASAVCSISGATVTFLTGGSCVINADQAGNTNYNAATQAQQLFTVAKALQTLTFTNPGNKPYGAADFQIAASVDSGLQLAFSVSQSQFFGGQGQAPPAPSCSVTATGVVTILEIGPCDINVDQAGNDTYLPLVTAQISFFVVRANQSTLSISSASSVAYGGTITLATSGGSGTGAVTYATTGTCSVSSGVLTVGDAGDLCTVTATKAADTHYISATSAAQSVTTTKANQTVALTSGTLSPVALGSYVITASATSGLTVAITVDASSSAVCSFSSGNLTFARSGVCKVNLNQAGNSNFNAATQVQETFTATKAAQTIAITNPGTKKFTDASFVVAASTNSNLTIAFSTGSNTTNSACSIAADGTVTINDVGTCEIVADQAGDVVYSAAATATASFTIAKGDQAALTMTSASSVAYGNTISLTSSGGSGTGAVTYATTGTCTVSGTTLTVGVVGSACTVTATKATDSQYLAVDSAAQTITIIRAAQATLTITSASSVAYGNTITLTTSGGSGDGAVTYATTGTCTEANGVLTVGVVGDACTVTATKAQSANYNVASSAAQTVTVVKASQQPLTITSANTLVYGQTLTLTTSGGSGSGAVSYAAVGECQVTNGNVLTSGRASQPCSVTATKAASANYNAISSATQSITITKADQTLTFTSAPLTQSVIPTALDTYQAAVSSDSNSIVPVVITVDASSSSVCHIDSANVVTYDTSGDCILNANQGADGNHTAAAQVQQTIAVRKAQQTITFPLMSQKRYTDAAFQAQATATSGLAITYSLGVHTTNNACSVTSSGIITINDVGFCDILADQAGNIVYEPAPSADSNFWIVRADQATLTLTNASTVVYGNTLTLGVSGGSGNGAVSYMTVGTCTESNGVLTVGNAGSSCQVIGIKAGDSQYNQGDTGWMTITITRAAQAAFAISSSSSVAFGGTIALTTSGGSGTGAVTYATTGTCTESAGILTVGHAGSACTVTATKAQSTNFNAATSATQTVTIVKANQTISFTSTGGTRVALTTYTPTATATSGLTVTFAIDSASSAVCSIANGVVTFAKSGSCVINADQAGDSDYNAAAQVQQTVTVTKATQTISWPQVADHPLSDGTVTVTPVISSGLTPYFSNQSSTVCTIDQTTGVITLIKVGLCAIVTSQDGNDTYAANYEGSNFQVTKGTQTALVINSATSVAYQGSINLTTTGGNGTGQVNFTATGACTITGTTLYPGNAGTACSVTAAKDGDINWLPTTSATVSITTTKINQAALTVTTAASVGYGETMIATYTGGSGNGAVTYATTGTCSISNGVISFGVVGDSCTVTATKAADTNYNATTSAAVSIAVIKANQSITFTSTGGSRVALTTYTPTATATSGSTVTFAIDSASSAVCSIASGVVTFAKSGSCVINASQSGDSNFNAATTAQQTVTVTKASQSIYWTQVADHALSEGTVTITPVVTSGLTPYFGGSSAVCSIDTNTGVITLSSVGTCAFYVQQDGNDTYAARYEGFNFEVTKGTQAALVINSATSVAYQGSINLTTTGGNGGGQVYFSATGACTITGTTLYPGNAGTSCVVTANKDGDVNWLPTTSASVSITTTKINQATLTLTTAASVGYGQTMIATYTGGSGTGAMSYATTGTCTVSSGVISFGVVGDSCTVTATKAADTNYNATTSATVSIAVVKASQTISITSTATSPTATGTYTVVATASSGLTPTLSVHSGSTSVCSVNGMVVTFLIAGSCVLDVDQAGDSNYNAASTAQQTVTVGKSAQTITLTNPGSKAFGAAAFSMVGSSTSSLTLTYLLGSSTTNSACSVTSSGTVTVLAVGDCQILADQAGDATYLAATQASVTFSIGKVDQATFSIASASTVVYGNTITLSTSGGSGTGAVTYATTGTCTEASGILTVGNAGSACTVTATKAADASYNAATSATQTVTVTRAAQAAFSITSGTSVTYGNTLLLTVSGGSGTGVVSYATTGTCTEASGVLTVGNAGDACTVTATKAQSTNYNSITSSSVTITTTKAAQTASFTSTTSNPIALGTYSVTATSTSGLTVAITVDSASSAVCSISGSTVTYLTSGSCVLNADQSGNGNYNAASTAQQTITVAKKAQTLTWSHLTLPDLPMGSAPFAVTAVASSGLQVSYYVLGSGGACSVGQSTGIVTLLNAGTCTLYSDQAGNSVWQGIGSATTYFSITQGTQATLTITSSSSVAYQGSITLTASGGSGTGAVSFAATGTCSISAGNILTPGDAGSACSVTATKDSDANWLSTTSAAQTITISRINQAQLNLVAASSATYGSTVLLNTTGGSGNGSVSYSTTGTCTVSGAVLTLGNVGDLCSVTATKAQSTNYNSITSSAASISVLPASQSVSFTSTASNPIALGTYTATATATSGLTVTITVDSASSAVCSISGSTVTYLTSGSCVLNAAQAGNGNYNAATTAQQTITVAKAAQTITFAQPADMDVTASATALTATASSNLQIAFALGSGTTNSACSVTAGGSVTPLAVGTCEITADQAGNATYSAAPRVTRSFAIQRATQTALTITSASTVGYGNTIALTTSGGSGTGAVSFATTGTCSVSGTTLIVGNAGSACTVTATKAADSTYSAVSSAAQTVTITRVNQPTLQIASANQMVFGQSLALSFTGGAGNGAETYALDTTTVLNSAGCAINNSITTLTATSAGACQFNLTKAASTNYNAATSASFTLVVTKAAQTINFTTQVPTNAVSGGSYAIAATTNAGLTVSFSLASGSSTYCSISGSTITFLATGNCVVNANQAGNASYNPAPTAQQTIAIGSINQTITFPAISNKVYGGASFGAGASVPSTAAITYALGGATTNGACSVTTNGVISIAAVGHCEIVASAGGDSQYAPASNVARGFEVVADRASAPFITSVAGGNGSITVAFTAPSYTGGAPITGYEINAYQNGILAATGSNCAANATSCTITGLANGVTYTIKMDAINAAGSGLESAASANIVPYTNPGAVSALAAVPGNNALNISWQQPASFGGGAFVSYQVFVRTHGGSYSLTPTATITAAGTTSYSVANLLNGQAYDIKVVVITTAASTQLVSNTTEIQQTPMTVPDAPQQLTVLETTDGVIDVSWAAPNSDGGSPVTAYNVNLGGGHSCTVSGQSTTCTIGNLTSSTTYTVTATATNAAGTSLGASTVITLRVGTATSSNPNQAFNAAFGITVDSVRAFASIDRTDRTQVSTAGGSRIVITGFGLDKINRVMINNTQILIIAKTKYELLLQLPGSVKTGWTDLWFYATGASLRYVDGVYYAQATVKPKPIVKVVYGFATPAKPLAAWQKAQIKSALKKAGNAKIITVSGTSNAAKLVADYVRIQRPTTIIRISVKKLSPASVTATVVKLTFTK